MQTTDCIHMSFEGDVQYPFADVGASELLHISEVTQENRRTFTYTCPFCKKELRPRLGSKKAHCFAHKPGDSCELDRYIHSTAERLLKEKWERDEPFEITMTVRTECENINDCVFFQENGKGCITEEVRTFDLKEQFTQCFVEKKVGDFIPDLCLVDDIGNHKPIFIEIWSKHKSSDKKVNSEYRIIEIRLKTMKDLEELTKHPITESKNVTFIHFKTLKKKPSKDDGPDLMRYTLYAGTLKSHVDTSAHCCNYRNSHNPKAIFEVVCSKDDIPHNRFHNYCNAIAIDKGYNIRNSFLCQLFGDQYGSYPSNDDGNFHNGCRRELKTRGLLSCTPEDAMTCQYFKLKDTMLNSMKRQYSNINRYSWYKSDDGSVHEEHQKCKDYGNYHESNWGRSLDDVARFDWVDDY